MRRRIRLAPLAVLLAAGPLLASPAPAPESKGGMKLEALQSIPADEPTATHRIVDVNGDGVDDLLVIGALGAVRTYVGRKEGGGFDPEARGALVLPDPARTALCLADVLGTGRAQLAVLSSRGFHVHEAGDDGAFRRAGVPVEERVRLRLRPGRPVFAEFLRDVNRDDQPDLIVPVGEQCRLYINEGPEPDAAGDVPETGVPRFREAARANVNVRRSHETKAGALSDVLESSLRIPKLTFEDVNGDGQDDLVVASDDGRSFHLQRDDGYLPAAPDVTLDLSVFRDTTPDARIALGKTLAGERDARLEVRDLDGDGIPDYVIAHRRKVWIFHGSKDGPQFTEPTSVLRTAEDVTALLVAPVDGDGYPDLLLLRVEVPALGAILRGLIAEWDLDISAVAYKNVDGRSFEKAPSWRSDIAIRLPAILGILRDPEALVSRFENLGKSFKSSVEGDLTGDGTTDLALVDDAGNRVDLWDGARTERDPGAMPADLAELLFGAEQKVWKLDGLLDWLSDLGRRQAAALTGGREADGVVALRDVDEFERAGVQMAATGGQAVLVVAYDRLDGKTGRVFDVYRITR